MLPEKGKKPAPELERGTSCITARCSTARQNPRFDPIGPGARTADRDTTFSGPSKSAAEPKWVKHALLQSLPYLDPS